MKKLTALFLALLLAVTVMPVASMAETYAEDDLVTVTFMMNENANQTLLQDTIVLNYIKEHFGLDIQIMAIPASDFSTKLSTSFATNDIADVTYGVTTANIGAFDLEYMCVNLMDYADQLPNYFGLAFDENNPTRYEATQSFMSQNSEGKDAMYILRKMEYDRVDIAPISAIRGDLLDELGLERPTSWAELYDVMLAIKEAHPDVYFFSSRAGAQRILACLAYGMGSGGFGTFDGIGIYLEPETDTWTYGPTQESFRSVVQYLANAWNDGLVDPDYASNDANNLWEKISTGKVVYYNDNNSFISRIFEPAFTSAGNDDWYFELLAPLANDYTPTRTLRYELDWSDGVAISKDCPALDRVLALFDWMYTDEGARVMNFGVEGESYYIDENGNPMIVDEIMESTAGAADQYAAINSVIGTGIWGMAMYIDEGIYRQIYGDLFFEQGDIIRGWTEEGLIDYKYMTPAFTLEEQEEVTELTMELQTQFDSNIDAFITGTRSMDEWDDFVQEQLDAGSERLEELYNTAYKR